MGDNHPKGWLIPHTLVEIAVLAKKASHCFMLALKEESASHQLVGEVMAHQGKDG